ncbi:hypothetical protein [Vibrio sp. 1F279]|uniref:Uncharacterized protein n=1 Tax=Vibrio tasmaniensis TaxID=212663 RepID=A0A0H3ZWX9_9VIBR|nr:hypothetical protein [Vibrio tasmaniensis]
MASMTRQERAKHYLKRLLNSRNKSLELEAILTELNGLVYTKTNEPLSRQEKLLILEELERLASNDDSILESVGTEHFKVNASDNSNILDVISAMKKRVGK